MPGGSPAAQGAVPHAYFEPSPQHHPPPPTPTPPHLTSPHPPRRQYAPLYDKYGLGLTTWSPLAFGVLTGKYSGGQVPAGTRFTLDNYKVGVNGWVWGGRRGGGLFLHG